MSVDADSTTEKLIYGTYFLSSFLFILSLGGLSHQETSRKGNYYGILGMAIAVIAILFSSSNTSFGIPMALKYSPSFGI